jgi:nitrate reductase delta subunit
MANTLKVISLLLSYPTAELLAAAPELHAALAADPSTGRREKAWLGALVDDLAGCDLYDAEERYVLLFDRTRTLSLHLFEHVHGESRDRGQAMVDLAQMYDRQGFDIGTKELPDFLPLFLEYLSTQSPVEVHELLAQTLHIVVALRERLQKRGSIYANALLALEALSGSQPDAAAVAELREVPEDDPTDLKALDAIWDEEAVTFGGATGSAACGPDRLRTQIRAANRPAPQPQPIGENQP